MTDISRGPGDDDAWDDADAAGPDTAGARERVRWWSFDSLLSPEAGALAAFTFAVMSMFGGGIASVVSQALLGFSIDSGNLRMHVVLPGVILLLFALLAVQLAARVIRDGWEDEPTWSGQLARAAVLVSLVGIVLSVVTIAGGWVAGRGSSSGLVPG